MGCCGKHKSLVSSGLPDLARAILPTDECVLCAEKHLSTAYALAQECGYEGVNRQRIIGEIVLSQWHVWHSNMKLAEKIRTIRHLIQQRREAEVDWHPLLTAMDALATAATLEDTTTTTKKEA